MSTQHSEPGSSTTPQVKGIFAWFARNSVAANMLMWGLLVSGAISMSTINQEVFPSFAINTAIVSVAYPGAAPEEIQDSILLPVEGAVAGVDAIAKVSSTAREGIGTIRLELIEGEDPNAALQDIRNAIDTIRTFPDDAEEPQTRLASRRRQVVSYAIYGDLDEVTRYELAQSIQNDLMQLPEVSQVGLTGVREPEIRIEIDQAILRSYELSYGDVANIVRRYVSDIPGGSLRTSSSEFLLRTSGRRDYASELRDIPVFNSITSGTVTLGDIASLKDTFDDEPAIYLVNGKPGFLITVFQVGAQRPLEVAAAVNSFINELIVALPDTVSVEKLSDTSEQFRLRIDLLLGNGYLGFVLVLLLLALTLEPRLAFWVALGIPISLIGAFTLLGFTFATINMISLFAFVLVIGIVVDDAIIVGEAIYQRIEKGMDSLTASIEGVRVMFVPVFLAVSTNIIAFTPLLVLPGTLGRIAEMMPIVAISAFLISLGEALFILPAHIAHHTGKPKPLAAGAGPIRRVIHGIMALLDWLIGLLTPWNKYTTRAFIGFRDRIFTRVLDTAIRRSFVTVTIFIAAFVLLVAWTVSGRLPMRFFPAIEATSVTATLNMNVDSPFDRTLDAARAVEAAGNRTVAQFGGDAVLRARSVEIDAANTTSARIQFTFVDGDDRGFELRDFTRSWRRAIPPQAGVRSMTLGFQQGPGANSGISIELSHENRDLLETAATDLATELAAFAGTTDIDNGFTPGKPQFDFTLTPEAAAAGLTLNELGRQVRDWFEGAEVLRQLRIRDEIKIIVRPPEEQRDSLADLGDMIVRLPDGGELMLFDAAKVSLGFAFSEIQRIDGKEVVSVTADVDTVLTTSDQILGTLGESYLGELENQYPGLSWQFGGNTRDRQDIVRTMLIASLGCLVAIFAMLAVAFRSYLQSLIVLMTIPFSIAAALLGHVVLGHALGFISFLGILALSGLVINGAQILMMQTNEYVQQGMSRVEAIREATVDRFRPIVLTSLTTTIGLLPLLFETSIQAQFLIPMAISLSFGVMFSTFVVLLMIPALYNLLLGNRGHIAEKEATELAFEAGD